MPVENYGVLKGCVVDGVPERNDRTPHYQIHMIGEEGVHYRIAVNVMSNSEESEVLYLVDEDFDAAAISILPTVARGFTQINRSNREIAIDYIRSKLFDSAKMKPLIHDEDGPDNDLNDLIDQHIKKAITEKATLYVYGSRFGPEDRADKVFGFKPTNGVHNVHMNQGNKGRFAKDNGVYHDGCILIQYESSWVAIFLAFLSQSWCTDGHGDSTGDCRHN